MRGRRGQRGSEDAVGVHGTLAAALAEHARRTPTSEALVAGERRWTYESLDARVESLARGFEEFGIRPGDRVGVWTGNRSEYVETLLACSRLGAVLVPINPRCGAFEAEAILDHAGACALVTEMVSDRSGPAALADGLRPPALVVSLEPGDGVRSWAELVEVGERASSRAGPAREVSTSDPALILYTSGTTGDPKGVVHTHDSLLAQAAMTRSVRIFLPGDRVMVQTPLATAAGTIIQTIPTLCAGATVVLLGKFTGSLSLDLIERERITAFVGAPTMYALQLKALGERRRNLGSLRHLIAGAAPVSDDLVRRVRAEFGAPVTNSYGATETGGLVTYLPEGAAEEMILETCGLPIPGAELRVVDADGREASVGETGEIQVRGACVMAGYHHSGSARPAGLLPGGWWASGDVGRLEADRALRVSGRSKDMYIRGGFNVYPGDIERVIDALPGVVYSAVIPYADPVLGERGRAVVMVEPGEALSADEVRAGCAARLADYKVPDDVMFVDDLPMIGPGKVDRKALAALASTPEPIHEG